MNILQFSLLSMKGRKLATSFTVLAIMIGVMLFYTILFISESIENGIKKQTATYDLIVGAKGSPTQLALNSILYIDAPTGNISYELYEQLQEDDRVLKVVPLALGDSFYGQPIIGTSLDYFLPFREGLPERYRLAEGEWFKELGEVVLGDFVAKHSKLQLGDTFVGTHGLEEDGHAHDQLVYRVVGILEATGGPDDKGIFTPYESVWAVHDKKSWSETIASKHKKEHETESGHHDEEAELTALLIKPEQLGFVPALKEELDVVEGVQAVYPVKVFRQLLETFKYGTQIALLLVSIASILALLLIVFAMISSISQRKQEMNILKAIGVLRSKIMASLFIEVSLLSIVGIVAGVVLSLLLFSLLSSYSLTYLGLVLTNVEWNLSYFLYAVYLFIGIMLVSLAITVPLLKNNSQ